MISRSHPICIFFLLQVIPLVASSSECGNHGEKEDPQQWVSDGGFILLIFGVCAMFWGLAVVCEEFFVPSLNILCEELNIPDDVAGATFMAAGASSPEMFTSFIALFVNHSAIGVGTVVGSEIFNHMIICAGSVLYSETGILQLEKYLFTRDVMAYILSLIALIWALKTSFFEAIQNVFDSDERKKCLDVTPVHAAGLVCVYFLYVTVSAYSQTIIKWIKGSSELDLKPLKGKDKEELTTTQNLALHLLPEGTEETEIETEVAEREEDRMASMLASIVEADIAATATTTQSSLQSKLLNQSAMHRPSTSVPPVLLRSYQLQRSGKYYPSGSMAGGESINSQRGGPGARSGRLPAVDWTQSKATFVNDAPLYTWRSSGVRLEYLEPPGQSFILTGYPDDSSGRARTAAGGAGAANVCHCFDSPKSEELLTSAISPQQFSAYLYHRVRSSYSSCLDQWELRYYTVDRWGFYSRKGRTSAPRGPHLRLIDLSHATEIKKIPDSKHQFQLIFSHGDDNGRGDEETVMEFSCPSEEIEKLLLDRLQTHLNTLQRLTADGRAECHRIAKRNLDGGWTAVLEEEDIDGHSSHGSIIDFPKVSPGSLSGYLQIIAHCLLLPLKFLFYHTLPNVTATTAGSKAREKYLLCLVMSIVWLAALSFVMISCCDAIGSFIGASPIVMGLTLSAIGTSFPNLWSSMLVARQGLGDMAVGNAFGSNTFNICIALGMPWLTRAVVTDFSSYRKMDDDGIVFMLLLLVLVAVIFYFTVMLHGWQIRKWMAYYFVVTYLAIMGYAIANG